MSAGLFLTLFGPGGLDSSASRPVSLSSWLGFRPCSGSVAAILADVAEGLDFSFTNKVSAAIRRAGWHTLGHPQAFPVPCSCRQILCESGEPVLDHTVSAFRDWDNFAQCPRTLVASPPFTAPAVRLRHSQRVWGVTLSKRWVACTTISILNGV